MSGALFTIYESLYLRCMRLQQFISFAILSLFILLSGYDSLEFFSGTIAQEHIHFSDSYELELEEEGSTSEESKEKDEETKFNDELFSETLDPQSFLASAHQITALNNHFQSSDFSAQVFSPPEFI